MSTPLQRSARIVPAIMLAALLGVVSAATASAEDPAATSFVFNGVLAADGKLSVTETIAFDAAPDELVQRIATEQRIDDSSRLTYDIGNVNATVAGANAVPMVTTDGDYTVISLDTSGAEGKEVVISYDVMGATSAEQSSGGDLTLLTWRVLQGLSVEVGTVSGSFRLPALAGLVDCTAGPPGTLNKCDVYAVGTSESPMPTFQTSTRGAGEQVTMMVGVPAGAVAATAVVVNEWSLDRAFTLSPFTASVALAALLLGGAFIWALHRRTGRDREVSGAVEPVATFRPVGAGESVFDVAATVRPGLVGTLADERVDPVDVTATLLDLAVRGYLVITELPREGHGLLDWTMERTTRSTDDLLAYERALLEAIAPAGGVSRVSELPATLAPAIGEVQGLLYDEVVGQGWFESRPDDTRIRWRTRGLVGVGIALVLAIGLVAFTTLGILALALLVLAATLLWVSDRMPRRTASGSRLVAGLGALSSLLVTHPVTQMPEDREIAEISRVLPYAVVLGGKDRWLDALVGADTNTATPDPTSVDWYHGPDTWHLQDLPVSLTQFITTVQGLLFAR